MTYVQSFSAVTPPPRYDAIPWTDLEILEAATEVGPFTLIDTQAIPVDASPDTPNTVEITTTVAMLPLGWYRFRFKDAIPNYSNYTAPVLAPAGADGSMYFTVAELRAKYPEITTVKYSDAIVAEAIMRAEETIERACDVAFVPRVRTIDLFVGERAPLSLPNNHVRAVTSITGATSGVMDITDLRVVAGSYLSPPWGWSAFETVTVVYSHGLDEPPRRIVDAAMLYARQLVLKGPIDDRATQIPVDGGGVINLLLPGVRGSVTGIPEVDAAIQMYSERVGIA